MSLCAGCLVKVFLYLHLCYNVMVINQPCRSQIRQLPSTAGDSHMSHVAADPRVGSLATKGPEVVPYGTTKTSGGTDERSFAHSKMRKRAYRRARRRAEERGGTLYRGRWRTAQELGTVFRAVESAAPARIRPTAVRPWEAKPRLQVRSYNAGGLGMESYD